MDATSFVMQTAAASKKPQFRRLTESENIYGTRTQLLRPRQGIAVSSSVSEQTEINKWCWMPLPSLSPCGKSPLSTSQRFFARHDFVYFVY